MHVREPKDFEAVRAQRRSRYRIRKLRHGLFLGIIAGLVVCLVAYGAYLRPVSALTAKTVPPTVTLQQVALSWPAKGQAAIGVADQGVMAATTNQQAVPTASVAKVMTALAVLKKRPLAVGQTGPTITMTAADVAILNNYIAQDGSVVRVEVGEQLTEYQALQAIMLPSANNVADSLAIWAYGSMDQYHVAANQLAQSLGMSQSKFAGDASGLLPESVSTAHDLVLLGQAALANPVLKAIASQKTADLPIVGTVSNVNALLGTGGLIGLKTGNSEQAGGCYLFAAERTVSGKTVDVIGAIMSSPSLGQAMSASLPLLDSFYQGFADQVVVPKGTIVAHYQLMWSKQTVNAVTAQDATVLNWRGSKVTVKVQPAILSVPQAAGTNAGELTAESNYAKTSTKLVLATPITEPNWHWRIIRR